MKFWIGVTDKSWFDYLSAINADEVNFWQPSGKQDIKALEDILFSEVGPIPREEYEKIYGEKPLGYLVRSVVGLDRKAAKGAFAEFLEKAPHHPEQIAFLSERGQVACFIILFYK